MAGGASPDPSSSDMVYQNSRFHPRSLKNFTSNGHKKIVLGDQFPVGSFLFGNPSQCSLIELLFGVYFCTQQFFPQVNGILNKITPEKYESLMQSMLELNFDVSNQNLLSRIIDCVFERAVQHQLFCNLYADVCRDLTQKFAQTHTKKEGEESKSTAYASFRRALLNKCQTEFEGPPPVPEGLSPEEKAEHEKKLKARQLGNIKFIGELFKRKMLTEKIMHEVCALVLQFLGQLSIFGLSEAS